MVKVHDCACLTVTELDPDPKPDGPLLDGLVNRCINAVADALSHPRRYSQTFSENTYGISASQCGRPTRPFETYSKMSIRVRAQ
jgi:hypothetical protein